MSHEVNSSKKVKERIEGQYLFYIYPLCRIENIHDEEIERHIFLVHKE